MPVVVESSLDANRTQGRSDQNERAFGVVVKPKPKPESDSGQSPPSIPEPSKPGKRYAVLIGVNEYIDPVISPLKYCSQDAQKLYDQLSKSGYEKNDIYLITQENKAVKGQPFKHVILNTLDVILGQLNPKDTILISMSGHGLETNGKTFFCPMDTKLDNLEGSTIDISSVFEKLHASKAGFKLMIVDACRERISETRSLASGRRSLVNSILSPPKGIVLMQSCSDGEFSYELEGIGQGVFSYYLVDGLKGNADANGDGTITFSELQEYVTTQTQRRVLKDKAAKQVPSLTFREVSNFTIATDFINVPEVPSEEYVAKNGDRVIRKYTEIIGKYPNFGKTYFYRGVVYCDMGKYQEAYADMKKAIELGHKDERLTEGIPALREILGMKGEEQ